MMLHHQAFFVPLLVLISLQGATAQINLFSNFFCSSNRGCFFGILGSTMHRGDGAECKETCALFPIFRIGWTCGVCEDDSTTQLSPVAPSDSTPALTSTPMISSSTNVPTPTPFETSSAPPKGEPVSQVPTTGVPVAIAPISIPQSIATTSPVVNPVSSSPIVGKLTTAPAVASQPPTTQVSSHPTTEAPNVSPVSQAPVAVNPVLQVPTTGMPLPTPTSPPLSTGTASSTTSPVSSSPIEEKLTMAPVAPSSTPITGPMSSSPVVTNSTKASSQPTTEFLPDPATETPVASPGSLTPVVIPVATSTTPPIKSPTASPTRSPTTSPTSTAPVSESPTTSPVSSAPIASPISGAPTFSTDNLPSGPYIQSGYSERITLPIVTEAVVSEIKLDCPHDDSDLLDWHVSSTWSTNAIPVNGEDVQLPQTSKVVIRRSVVEKLGIVTIPEGSSLIIAENASGIELTVHGMDVQGSLVVGSATCRLTDSVTITLTGARPDDAVTNPKETTYKGISVPGTISLHGKRYFRTWSRLSKSVVVDDRVLLLQDVVNWEPGLEIVLVSTALKDSREWHQNHVNTIAGVVNNPVSGVGSAVYLNDPIPYEHIANGGYQGEVGLLSRTIKIQGSAVDSEPTDTTPMNTCKTTVDALQRFGDTSIPCHNHLTGFGGHVMVHGGGRGFIEGVEFLRMGQTNVLGRYPMHFHLLGDCPECYLRDSSIHRSFYRCVSIHGTNQVTITENVAYDVIGFCYYLEDGVETDNTISFNLAAHVHSIGEPPETYSQTTETFVSSDELTLPADATAAGFYITNIHNNIIGNAASGGYFGFAFPSLPTALQSFRNDTFRPSSATSLTIDGNSAHSTGWWWDHAGAFYFGGALYYNSDDVLEYNPGRSFNFDDHTRRPCKVNACLLPDGCVYGCPNDEKDSVLLTNTKAFLVSGVGLNSWTGTMELQGFETHDTGLALESLSDGFWIDDLLAVCRTGEHLVMPSIPETWEHVMGSGFVWYDTAQEHIITDTTFRNCGYQSSAYAEGDGCGVNIDTASGCRAESTVFGFLTHSDQFTPEVMQATRNITFERSGRHFSLDTYPKDYISVSGRNQNWLDADGSVSGLGVPTLIGSGYESAATWWGVDDNVVLDTEGPLRFIKTTPMTDAPERGLGHITMTWDDSEHDRVGKEVCGNGSWEGLECPDLGFVRHAGSKFTDTPGLPVNAVGDIVGPVGGFGWILQFNGGAPRSLKFTDIEVLPETPMLMSIAYPPGTTFSIAFQGPSWCYTESTQYTCFAEFTQAATLEEVSRGPGDQFYVDADGVLTFRISQPPESYAGPKPDWSIPQRTDLNLNGPGFALGRFERNGVYLPKQGYGTYLQLEATCGGTGAYCDGSTVTYDPDVCQDGHEQYGYDHCCKVSDPSDCIFATAA